MKSFTIKDKSSTKNDPNRSILSSKLYSTTKKASTGNKSKNIIKLI